MRRHVRASRDDRGAQAVEFALVVPVLLALAYGIMSLGFTFYAQINATQLAREGARAAAICSGTPGCNQQNAATTRVNDNAAPGLQNVATALKQPCTTPSGDAMVVVSVTPFMPLPGVTVVRGKSSTPCGG